MRQNPVSLLVQLQSGCQLLLRYVFALVQVAAHVNPSIMGFSGPGFHQTRRTLVAARHTVDADMSAESRVRLVYDSLRAVFGESIETERRVE